MGSRLVIVLLSAVLATACATTEQTVEPTLTWRPTPLISTPAPVGESILEEPANTPIPRPELQQTRPITLTLWVPEEFAPGAERGGDILEKQVFEFESANPTTKLKFVLKAPYGRGGILDWLRQVNELVPERLPDLAIVDSRELDELGQLGLLQRLDHDLPAGLYFALFSPAQAIASPEGYWTNLPYSLDLEHLVYDSRRIDQVPSTWDEVTLGGNVFAFAGDSTETFLLHYLANGGSLSPGKQPAKDAGIMQLVLSYLQGMQAAQVLDPNTALMKSAREVMPLFVSGQTAMAQVRAQDYVAERESIPTSGAAPVPSLDGKPRALTVGWSYVVVTADPVRREEALKWLEWVSEPSHHAEWAKGARMIPSSKSAFAQTFESDEYADLLWSLLETSTVSPSLKAQAPYAAVWHNAVQAVLTGQLAPADAAARAVESLMEHAE